MNKIIERIREHFHPLPQGYCLACMTKRNGKSIWAMLGQGIGTFRCRECGCRFTTKEAA